METLSHIDSASVVDTGFCTVELARACAVQVGPASLLPAVQAQTALGSGRQAFQVLRIAFLICALRLPSSCLSLAALSSFSSRSVSAHRRARAEKKPPHPGDQGLGTVSFFTFSDRPCCRRRSCYVSIYSLLPRPSGANLASRQSWSIHSTFSIQQLPPRLFDRPHLRLI